jgi:hypothetical protein
MPPIPLDKFKNLDTSAILNVVEVRAKQIDTLRHQQYQLIPQPFMSNKQGRSNNHYTTLELQNLRDLVKEHGLDGSPDFESLRKHPTWKMLNARHSDAGISSRFYMERAELKGGTVLKSKQEPKLEFCPECKRMLLNHLINA